MSYKASIPVSIVGLTLLTSSLTAYTFARESETSPKSCSELSQALQATKTRLQKLETQQEYLERQLANLGQSYQLLRHGNVALSQGQVLAAGVVRVESSGAREAVASLLQEANRTAIQVIQPSTKPMNEQAVLIPENQVEQLIKQIDNGRDYVVRIRSAGNYVVGEKHVQVFADVANGTKLGGK